MPDGLILSKLILSGHERDQGISDTLLATRSDLPEDALSTIKQLQSEAARLAEMTQAPVDAIAKDFGAAAWTNAKEDSLKEFLEDVVWLPRMIAKKRRPGIRISVVAQATRVHIPRVLVAEVLDNLIRNALDHAVEATEISVSAAVLTDRSYRFEVTDDGRGEGTRPDDEVFELELPEFLVDAEESSVECDPKKSEPRQGVGLKLSGYIVKKILNGEFGRDTPNGKTRYWFRIWEGGTHGDRHEDSRS